MTATTDAPKLIWARHSAHGLGFVPCFPHDVGAIQYIRVDAPELVALVSAIKNVIALVNGECPRIFDEDRAGYPLVEMDAEDAIEAFTALIAKDTAND